MSNLSCGTHVAEPSANKDCRKLLNQFCRFLPKLKLPISADAKLPLTKMRNCMVCLQKQTSTEAVMRHGTSSCRTMLRAMPKA